MTVIITCHITIGDKLGHFRKCGFTQILLSLMTLMKLRHGNDFQSHICCVVVHVKLLTVTNLEPNSRIESTVNGYTGHKSHWTKIHYFWLVRTIDGLSGSLKVNLELLLRQLKALNEVLTDYGQQIEVLASSPRYQPAVHSLTCYKGIKNIFALTMITEIGDIKRFSHPRKLVSWIGMDIREYSSGGKHNRFGITKHGNRYLRTAFVEANQRGYRTARIGKDVKARRKDIAPELINIADRCLRRLNKKGNRLLLAGKHPNKVKVACAREMVGFVWESLNKAAA